MNRFSLSTTEMVIAPARTFKVLTVCIRVLSLTVLLVLFWYIMISPSLELEKAPRDGFRAHLIQLDNAEKEKKDKTRELAKLDLEKKVYPEIQDRLTKVNDWLIKKIGLAGALLGAFLLQLWWPFWSQNSTKKGGRNPSWKRFWSRDITRKEEKNHLDNCYESLLKFPHTCAVLGIACTVSLFMDLHIRRSLTIIHQLGTWAGEYADPVLGGEIKGFPGWEQFIRMPGPETPDMPPGMHRSLIDALQTGDLYIMTLVLFAFYHWPFQAVCIQRRLDEFNRLVYWVFISTLFIFTIGNCTSGNFKLIDYGWKSLISVWGPLFSDFRYAFAAWFVVAMIIIFSDALCVLSMRRNS